jgi:hypothetical protein
MVVIQSDANFDDDTSDNQKEFEELRAFTEQSEAFNFWHDEREDLYQDFLPQYLASRK